MAYVPGVTRLVSETIKSFAIAPDFDTTFLCQRPVHPSMLDLVAKRMLRSSDENKALHAPSFPPP